MNKPKVMLLAICIILLITMTVVIYFLKTIKQYVVIPLCIITIGLLVVFMYSGFLEMYIIGGLVNLTNIDNISNNLFGNTVYISRVIQYYLLVHDTQLEYYPGIDFQKLYMVDSIDPDRIKLKPRNIKYPAIIVINGLKWQIVPPGEECESENAIDEVNLYQIITQANFEAFLSGSPYPNKSILSRAINYIGANVKTTMDVADIIIPMVEKESFIIIALDDNRLRFIKKDDFLTILNDIFSSLPANTSPHHFFNILYFQMINGK